MGLSAVIFFQLFACNGKNSDGLNGKLHLKIEIGPFEDSANREKILSIFKIEIQ